MKIEEAIKQKEFRNEYQKASINLTYAFCWLSDKQRIFFEEFDITTKQFNVLRILKGQHPGTISTAEIKNRMMDKSSDASRIVDRMMIRGLITKQVCPVDKRLVDVGISEKGLKLLDTIEARISVLDNLLSGITKEEAYELNRILDKIRSTPVEDVSPGILKNTQTSLPRR